MNTPDCDFMPYNSSFGGQIIEHVTSKHELGMKSYLCIAVYSIRWDVPVFDISTIVSRYSYTIIINMLYWNNYCSPEISLYVHFEEKLGESLYNSYVDDYIFVYLPLDNFLILTILACVIFGYHITW